MLRFNLSFSHRIRIDVGGEDIHLPTVARLYKILSLDWLGDEHNKIVYSPTTRTFFVQRID
jgi:hypothetical protein